MFSLMLRVVAYVAVMVGIWLLINCFVWFMRFANSGFTAWNAWVLS